MSKFYAQLDASNMVMAVTQTHSAINASHMIELKGYEVEKLGHEYDPATGIFTSTLKPTNQTITITTKEFFRRLTASERSALRPRIGGARLRDLKEDLEREATVVLDAALRTLFEESGIFSTTRIDELMKNGS